jgi:hypothetical protein
VAWLTLPQAADLSRRIKAIFVACSVLLSGAQPFAFKRVRRMDNVFSERLWHSLKYEYIVCGERVVSA